MATGICRNECREELGRTTDDSGIPDEPEYWNPCAGCRARLCDHAAIIHIPAYRTDHGERSESSNREHDLSCATSPRRAAPEGTSMCDRLTALQCRRVREQRLCRLVPISGILLQQRTDQVIKRGRQAFIQR